MNVGHGKTTTAHPDDIEPNQVGKGAVSHPKGDYIGPHPAQPDDHGTLTNAHELPDRDATSENDVIANGHVSTQ
jgi:hypothetical protein